jgi:hypothetical protein
VSLAAGPGRGNHLDYRNPPVSETKGITMNRKIATVIAAAASLPLLAGCGAYAASHDYNAPTPAKIFPGDWTRIETPGNFPSMVFECHGRDGVYDNQDSSSSPFVVPNDPECAK